MLEHSRTSQKPRTYAPAASSLSEDDKTVMRKIREILSRGNNAEIKNSRDGGMTVMEIKKHIV